ncbi:MAG: 1-acyl-sn-glycerol-3-phosphate acyltransferase [Chloroflexi bacterium]|nr:1-acyl-sn-glycerol-3-phosphate acyltransferase [Chloroflexota bacterium]
MTLTYQVVTSTIKGLLRFLCRVDDAQLARVPDRGPLIIVANHVNFLEVPLLYTHLQPRSVTGFAKAEIWDNPALGALFDLGGAIPLQRGEADMVALRQALKVLEAGHILAVAPEGTRSGHGRLQRGKPGVVFLALHSGAPLLPVVYYGGELFWRNLSRLRRTDFHIVVGQPFYLEPGEVKITRQVRQLMVDEIMYQVAALLPQAYRGVYAELAAATEAYLRFPDGVESNLHRRRVGTAEAAEGR